MRKIDGLSAMSRRRHSPAGTLNPMIFFLKSVRDIFLVCVALDWRTREGAMTQATGSARPRTAGANRDSLRGPPARSATAGLRGGAEAIERAARRRCFSHPQNCLALAKRPRNALHE
ncbi:MAG: hypothetical protein N2444_06215 [Methylocystis sp.]|nr:hypothetical protein [Methylocystis sp.]